MNEPEIKRKGDWIQTYTGRRFWPLDPRPEEIFIEDIAHSLSLLCRYTGHVRVFYSVAQHSCLVSDYLATQGNNSVIALWGLLHDAGEAYIGDHSRPVKRSLRFRMREPRLGDDGMAPVRFIEEGILTALSKKIQLPFNDAMWTHIAYADNVLLATEVRDFMTPCEETWGKWTSGVPTLPEVIEPWSPSFAEAAFKNQYDRLMAKIA